MPKTTLSRFIWALKKEELQALVNHIKDISENAIQINPDQAMDQLRRDLSTTLRNRTDLRIQVEGLEHLTEDVSPHPQTDEQNPFEFPDGTVGDVHHQHQLDTQVDYSDEEGASAGATQSPSGHLNVTERSIKFKVPRSDRHSGYGTGAISRTRQEQPAADSIPNPELQRRLAEVEQMRQQLEQLTANLRQQQQHPGPRDQPSGSVVLRFLKEARGRKLAYAGLPADSPREFLMQFDHLVQLMGVSTQDRLLVFRDLLIGEAQRWVRSQRGVNDWHTLRERFEAAYLPRQQDAIILNKIVNRRQAEGERPLHFIAAVTTMNDRLASPLTTPILISTLTSNMLPVYQEKLAGTYPAASVQEFIDLCCDLETTVQAINRFRPSTAELLADPDIGFSGAAGPSSRPATAPLQRHVTALQQENPPVMQVDALTTGCFNCQQEGHFYAQCPRPLQVFCKLCGKLGTRTADCCRKRFVRQTRPPGPHQPQRPNLDEDALMDRMRRMVQEAVSEALRAQQPKN